MRYGYSPTQAGNNLLRFCAKARQALVAALDKPPVTDGIAFEAYVLAKVAIVQMDHSELRQALTSKGIQL
ncbi:MAG: hypothetical protein CMJ75_19025 [Planctomycetaceae bacterium]|nr:hypothetical protein [Planctomycetaceae bacterium]